MGRPTVYQGANAGEYQRCTFGYTVGVPVVQVMSGVPSGTPEFWYASATPLCCTEGTPAYGVLLLVYRGYTKAYGVPSFDTPKKTYNQFFFFGVPVGMP